MNADLSRRLPLPVAGLLALVAVFSGGCCCFTTPYDTVAYATWGELERGLNANSPPPVKTAGSEQTKEQQTGITIRLPALFNHGEMTLLLRGAAEDGKPVSTDRIEPPGLSLPGYYETYEMFYPSEKGEVPVYCYLGAVPKAESTSSIKQGLLGQLKEKYPDAKWDSKMLPETNGSVDVLSVSGSQPFYAKGQQDPVELPGRTDIYVAPKEHANVVVAWRAPTSIAKQLSFFKAAAASVESIKSEKPAQPIQTPSDPGGGQPKGDYVQFPNAPVELIPPQGFQVVARINGFQKDGSPAKITVLQQQNPYDSLVKGYTDAYFKNNNLKVVSREGVTADSRDAVLWLIEQPGGQQYWLLVFGDNQQSFIVTGILDDKAATKADVANAMLSARKKK